MPKTYTVADIAERLARVTGQSATYHARQLRHWGALDLFPEAGFPAGAGPTAARTFYEHHIVEALIYTILSGQGFTADQLAHVHDCFKNTSLQMPAKTKGGNYVTTVDVRFIARWIEQNPDQPVFFSVFSNVIGKVGGGGFGSAERPNLFMSGVYPVITSIRIDRLVSVVMQE